MFRGTHRTAWPQPLRFALVTTCPGHPHLGRSPGDSAGSLRRKDQRMRKRRRGQRGRPAVSRPTGAGSPGLTAGTWSPWCCSPRWVFPGAPTYGAIGETRAHRPYLRLHSWLCGPGGGVNMGRRGHDPTGMRCVYSNIDSFIQ